MSKKNIEKIKRALIKSQPVSSDELAAIEAEFDRLLQRESKSRIDWLRDRDIESKEPILSNMLAGRVTSKPLMKLVINYILNELETETKNR